MRVPLCTWGGSCHGARSLSYTLLALRARGPRTMLALRARGPRASRSRPSRFALAALALRARIFFIENFIFKTIVVRKRFPKMAESRDGLKACGLLVLSVSTETFFIVYLGAVALLMLKFF